MKTICLYFQVHEPMMLKRYRFFNMGKDHNYLDDAANRSMVQKVAMRSYEPMNKLLLELIQKHKGAFKVSFSLSGVMIEQLRNYAPQVLDSFRDLAATGCVEFLGGTYSHSLASLIDAEEFADQVRKHSALIESEFGQKPTTLRNTELIYSDGIGEMVANLGFESMVVEGAKHLLGWKSPNYVYANAISQNLRLLLRNYKLSDDISFSFNDRSWSEWPLTADKYAGWMADESTPGEVINIGLDYSTFGVRQGAETGVFDFMRHLPAAILKTKRLEMATATEAARKHQPVAVLHSPHPTSWAEEERDVALWLGNELQDQAVKTLYAQRAKVKALGSPDFDYVWDFLQSSEHFYFMATKWFSAGAGGRGTNPYGSTYDAFINYMNVLSDFIIELDKCLAAKSQPTDAAVLQGA